MNLHKCKKNTTFALAFDNALLKTPEMLNQAPMARENLIF